MKHSDFIKGVNRNVAKTLKAQEDLENDLTELQEKLMQVESKMNAVEFAVRQLRSLAPDRISEVEMAKSGWADSVSRYSDDAYYSVEDLLNLIIEIQQLESFNRGAY